MQAIKRFLTTALLALVAASAFAAVTYSTAVKTARMTAVRDQIDGGAGAGVLQIGTTGMGTVLAEFTLNDPSGTISGAVLTFSGFPKTDSSANASGTAAAARIRDSNGTDIITGLTVGTSGADLILDNTNITSGQQVTINSATITHARIESGELRFALSDGTERSFKLAALTR